MDIETLAHEAVACAYKIHCELGPGLLESVYEAVLAKRLTVKGLRVERQRPSRSNLTASISTKAFEPIC